MPSQPLRPPACAAARYRWARAPAMNLLLRGLTILLVFELGVLLLIMPWSAFWERNWFLQQYPALIPVLLNPFVRGAVSGLGLLDVLIAAGMVFSRGKRSRQE